jgi:predicted RNase H-like HicB family nuclease
LYGLISISLEHEAKRIRKEIEMKYHFKIHKEGDKYWAQGIELDTCFTQANSLKGLHKNMQEVLNLYIEEPADSTYLAPLPDENIKLSKNNVIEVEVDPFIAFSFLVRRCRIMHGITQQEAANRMGFAKGANANVANKLGETPLYAAAYKNHQDIVNLLLTHGANANLANEKGETLLYWAVYNNRPEIVSLLLVHGARVNETSVELANQKGYLRIATLLKKY